MTYRYTGHLNMTRLSTITNEIKTEDQIFSVGRGWRSRNKLSI
jgi:hypothetical protein